MLAEADVRGGRGALMLRALWGVPNGQALSWDRLLRARHGGATRVYVHAVVMRIPSYNGDFEEPWYWQT